MNENEKERKEENTLYSEDGDPMVWLEPQYDSKDTDSKSSYNYDDEDPIVYPPN